VIESGRGPNAPAQPIVVDTDVVSYIFKRDTRAVLYLPHLTNRAPVVSFMTVAELEFWAEVRNWGRRTRQRLVRFLVGFSTHYPDPRMCGLWAIVRAQARRAGQTISAQDAWIAATALILDCPLITHNPRDFRGIAGLTVISERA